jgi:YD repeat-containing protein
MSSPLSTTHFQYDGSGNLTQQTDALGNIFTYDYDAFGNLINSTGSTPNNYLFAGEQFDQLEPAPRRVIQFVTEVADGSSVVDTRRGRPGAHTRAHPERQSNRSMRQLRTSGFCFANQPLATSHKLVS